MRVKAPQAAFGKLGDFAEVVQPGVGAVVKGNLAMLGLVISNPTLAGVDVEKDWWAIVFAEPRQQPALVFDRMSGKGLGLWSKIDASTKNLFGSSGLSVFIHLRQLTKAFESELQRACDASGVRAHFEITIAQAQGIAKMFQTMIACRL